MKPIVEGVFNKNWSDYVTQTSTDLAIQKVVFAIGLIFLAATIVFVLFRIANKSLLLVTTTIVTVLLCFLVLSYWKDKHYQIGMLIELSLQAFSPLLFYWLLFRKDLRLWKFATKLFIALTFVGHGLYALNYHPVPWHFIDMTTQILKVSNEGAMNFLLTVGILDVVIAIGIWIRGLDEKVLLYATFWGLATTVARIIGNIEYETGWSMVSRWGYEVLIRFPHFLVPLALYLFIRSSKSIE